MSEESDIRMPFGKFKGEKVKDLPGPYVFGLVNNVPITSPRLEAALLERLEQYQEESARRQIIRMQRARFDVPDGIHEDLFGGAFVKFGGFEEEYGPNGEYWNSDMEDEYF